MTETMPASGEPVGDQPELRRELDLDEWRKRQGMSLEDVADILGCSISAAGRKCRGEVDLTPLEFDAIHDKSAGEVGLYGLHRKQMEYIREARAGGVPVSSVCESCSVMADGQ